MEKQTEIINLLHVEDNQLDADLLADSLEQDEQRRYQITRCIDGDSALEQIRSSDSKFDVVLADYHLPTINGLDFLKILLKEKYAKPMVLITGIGTEHLAVEALKSGVDDYVPKDGNGAYLELLPIVIHESLLSHENKIARAKAEYENTKMVSELKQALEDIKTLSGLIPICANCKKIHNDRGAWEHIEQYIESHTHARFSHAICEECAETLYKGSKWWKKRQKKKHKPSS
ncbi:MAG: response regulator [Proteobacteria bacterium]|nr:response regulator [Pseudomonadota bacterium]